MENPTQNVHKYKHKADCQAQKARSCAEKERTDMQK